MVATRTGCNCYQTKAVSGLGYALSNTIQVTSEYGKHLGTRERPPPAWGN